MATEIPERTINNGSMFSAQAWDNYLELLSEGVMIGLRGNSSGSQKELLFMRLDTNGDGTGTQDMAVDASLSPIKYFIKPPAGEVWRVARWMLYVQDTKGFDVGLWGNGVVLTNGIVPKIKQNGVERNMTPMAIKSSGNIAEMAYDMTLHTFGSADDILVARWTFTKAGQYLRLDGDLGDELQVIINDDLTGLSSQYVQIQGYKE